MLINTDKKIDTFKFVRFLQEPPQAMVESYLEGMSKEEFAQRINFTWEMLLQYEAQVERNYIDAVDPKRAWEPKLIMGGLA